MEIKERELKSLKPYEKNPRINDGAVDAVASSIQNFGFKVPLIIDKGGVIVAGHTRYKAALKLGLKTVPCIIADDLTEEQIKAFRLADNKTAELSSWDMPLLGDELKDILDIDMSDFGFDLDLFGDELGVNDSDFISDTEITKSKKKTVVCPYCGKEFEV